ncbi:MAG: HEPN domain-containing protein [Bacteroidota bacterium]
MNKQEQNTDKLEHIEYWKISAGKSLTPAKHLFEAGDYVECLFLAHLTLEKLLKAHWVKDNTGDVPPKIHNLHKLASQTQLKLIPEQIAFLQKMNTFQMEGRYPDYNFSLYQDFDEHKTKQFLEEAENLYQWLLSKLP